MTVARYDEIAEWYDEMVRGWSQLGATVTPLLIELAGDVSGARVCDLGCGQGILARELAGQGAQVVGVDISEKLLEIARGYETESPLGVQYVHDDAARLSKLADSDFDGVVCNWSLVDIADLESCAHAVARVLRPNGWFVFTMPHPCFLPRDTVWPYALDKNVSHLLHKYFQEGFSPPGEGEEAGVGIRSRVGRHYRTLSTYLNALADARLVLDHLIELPGTAGYPTDAPTADALPPIMLARCLRTGAALD